MISTKRVVRVTKAEKLCNPSESLQVGRYCRIRRPLFFFFLDGSSEKYREWARRDIIQAFHYIMAQNVDL